MTVADKYELRRPEFLKHLEGFVDVWDGQLVQIATARRRIELFHEEFRHVYSVTYRAISGAR